MADLGWRLFEAFLYLVAIILALIGLTFPYLLCCGPGVGLLWITYRWRNETTPGRTLAVAAVHAIFFAPAAILLAHNIFIVPVFVGAIAYWFIDGIGRMWWLAASSGTVFAGSIVFQRVRSNFRLQRTPASGRR
jgi:hypothetical protein